MRSAQCRRRVVVMGLLTAGTACSVDGVEASHRSELDDTGAVLAFQTHCAALLAGKSVQGRPGRDHEAHIDFIGHNILEGGNCDGGGTLGWGV